VALKNRGEFGPFLHSVLLRRHVREAKRLHRLQKRQTPLFENDSATLVRLIARGCDQMLDIQPADFIENLALFVRGRDRRSVAAVLDLRLLAHGCENIDIKKDETRQNNENKDEKQYYLAATRTHQNPASYM
jgi:hypothetical protein